MYTFKHGDKIRQKNGESFSNNEKVVTVNYTYTDNYYRKSERVKILETGTHIAVDEVELAFPVPTAFEETLKELEKELIIYQEKLKEAGEKVDKLELTIATLKEIDKERQINTLFS